MGKFSNSRGISIPKCERALKYLRNQKIRSAYGPTSMSVLAQTYGLSESQITRIVHDQEVRTMSANVQKLICRDSGST